MTEVPITGQSNPLMLWFNILQSRRVPAGKTLVGLLIAQSLANDTCGKVLYACNSIQLLEQTRDKAQGYGMDVTPYFRQA